MKKKLEIIYTSDVHGHVFPVNYAAGKPEASGLLNMAAQMNKTTDTLVLDGGDALQGTPLTSYYLEHSGEYPFHPVAEGFNAMECDYFTLGNHDFNFGYDAMKQYLDAMKATCLCANVTDLRGELRLAADAVYVTGGGLRVGLTGVVTDFVNVWEQPQNLTELKISDPFEAAKAAYERLKDSCDVCICIYHGGFEEDLETGRVLSDSGENIACRLARELDFDLLLTGHQHMPVAGVNLNGTYTVQPPAGAGQYIHIDLAYEEGTTAAPIITSTLESTGDIHNEEPYHLLLPVEHAAQRWLDMPIGKLLSPIQPEPKLDAALYGSRTAALFNQVQLAETGADFSCTSLGNDPVGLTADVTMREICGAYLFANTLVLLEVNRHVIRSLLERCASYFTLENGRPQISDSFLHPKVEHYNYDFFAGLQYRFDLTKPVGQRVVHMAMLDGTPLTDRTYRLVTSNYRATGTGGYDSIRTCPILWRGTTEMPELAANYIQKNSPIPILNNSLMTVTWE